MRFSSAIFTCVLVLGCSEYNLGGNSVVDQPFDTGSPAVTGDQPDIDVNPLFLPFGWWPQDCLTDPQIVTVSNVGTAILTIDAIDLMGVGTDSFIKVDDLDGQPATLAPGEELEFEVSFQPKAQIEYSDVYVQILSDDPDEPETDVTLTGTGSEDAYREEWFTQPEPGPVDVLWVVDNSGSMSGEIEALGDQFYLFIEGFLNLGIDDYHIAVVSTDMVDPTHSGRIQGEIITSATADPNAAFVAATDLGSDGSADERGLDASYQAVCETTAPGAPVCQGVVNAENDGFIRPDATLAVVVVSDENDSSSINKSEYVDWMNAFKKDTNWTSLSGIVGPESGGIGGCGLFSGESADAAPIYHYVLDETGGIWANICDMDFVGEFMTFLSYTAAGLPTVFPLSDEPTNIGFITVQIDGDDIPFNGIDGWTYDSDTNSIEFNGNSIPGPGTTVSIMYPIASDCETE